MRIEGSADQMIGSASMKSFKSAKDTRGLRPPRSLTKKLAYRSTFAEEEKSCETSDSPIDANVL